MTFDKQNWSKEYYLKNKQRIDERNKKWNNENKDKVNKLAREWKKRNPEKARKARKDWIKKFTPEQRFEIYKKWRDKDKKGRAEYQIKYQEANREKINGLHRKWVKENIEKAKHLDRIQYARRKMAIGSFTLEDWNEIKKRQKYKCNKCGKEELTIDHIIPLSKGGTNYKDNIQGLCKHCNCSKNNKLLK